MCGCALVGCNYLEARLVCVSVQGVSVLIETLAAIIWLPTTIMKMVVCVCVGGCSMELVGLGLV